MKHIESRFGLQLDKRGMFNVPDAAGLHVVCRRGVVWITLDGVERDFVLQAGERFDNHEHRRALIYAIEASSIDVLAAVPDRAQRVRGRGESPGMVFEPVAA
jgi:hypothetical protein